VNRINPALLPQRAAAQPGELRYSIADISAARNAFGYAPARSLASDLDAVIDYIRSGL
jgi:hypothetical protein